MPRSAGSNPSAFERAYSIVVAVKGFDGAVELLAGLVLLVAPRLTGSLLEAFADELGETPSPLLGTVARSVDHASGGVAAGAVPLALFLLVHGLVKLTTVYALLRRAIRWYPLALAALTALLVVQVVALVASPTAGGAVLTVLDVAVVVLVLLEYRHLRAERVARIASRIRGARAVRAERASAG